MEYTIAKVMFEKQVQGRNGMQHNIRFTTNETGDKSISGFFDEPLKEGQKIVGEIVEKPGQDRNGNPQVYNNFHAEKKGGFRGGGGGMSPEQYQILMREIGAIRTELQMIRGMVDPEAGLTSAGTPVPDFTPRTMNVDPELASLEASAESAMNA
jgi:hypothetical protein